MSFQETLELVLDGGGYEIQVGNDLIPSSGELILPYLKEPRAIVITDENVALSYLSGLKSSLLSSGISSEEIILPSGEQTKDFKFLKDLVSHLLDLKVERDTTLLALGGGVIGDLTGFTAAILLRGINYIHIPTTLLAQVDSSVGGKTGINTPHGKNLVGAFYQPKLVLADINCLETLPNREVLSGYAEVAKYGLINDVKFFEWLEKNGLALCRGDKELQQKAVIHSCQAKARIVSEDERELGNRTLLNLGHTFAHTLEAETGFSDILLHGEAVAIGICLAYELSCRLGLCTHEEAERVQTHYRSVGLPTNPNDVLGMDWNTDALLSHMANDKKVKDGHIRFILARGIGQAFVTDNIDIDDVRSTLDHAIFGS